MKSTIKIPNTCKVGFKSGYDTITGNLGYVIYFDGKVWRKETSWEDWSLKYITPEEYEAAKKAEFDSRVALQKERYFNSTTKSFPTVEEELRYYNLDDYEKYRYSQSYYVSSDETIKPKVFDNVPTSGFILNKKAGGYSGGWNPRQSYARVYDPRGFEIEITIENLLYILEHSISNKKELSGNFVYGWDGAQLVLVPEAAPEFVEMLEFTTMQESKTLNSDELIPGGKYIMNSGETKFFIGKFKHYNELGQSLGNYFHFGYYYRDVPFENDSKTHTAKKYVGMGTEEELSKFNFTAPVQNIKSYTATKITSAKDIICNTQKYAVIYTKTKAGIYTEEKIDYWSHSYRFKGTNYRGLSDLIEINPEIYNIIIHD